MPKDSKPKNEKKSATVGALLHRMAKTDDRAQVTVQHGSESEAGQVHIGVMDVTNDKDAVCFVKAKSRGDLTFTLVGQEVTSPKVIAFWIMENIETCPAEKLHEALNRAIAMRSVRLRHRAD